MDDSSSDDEVSFLFAGGRKEQPPGYEDTDFGLDMEHDRMPTARSRPGGSNPGNQQRSGASSANVSNFSFEGMSQVQDLVNQNASLQQTVELKNAEIRALLEQISSVPDGASDIAAKKIKELAKKNRDLNLMVERERNKVSKLEKEVSAAASEVHKEKQRANRAARPNSASSSEGGERRVSETAQFKATIKEWKEKFAQSNLRVTELRQELHDTKTEYTKMRRALQREVGEDVDLSKVLDDSSNWRGRAQQVALLQQRVKTLKKQMDNASENGSVMGESSPRRANAEMDLDDKHQREIEKRAQRRGESRDELQAALSKREDELQHAKTRYDAASARCRTLEGDVKSLKSKLQVLLDKTENDDKLIDAIRAEMNKAQEREKTSRRELAALQKEGSPRPEQQPMMHAAAQHQPGERMGVTQQVKMQEQHMKALEVAKKESQALRTEMVSLQQKLRAAQSEGSKLKVNASQHNDIVMKSKLQEVETQKVKEFCELLQSDIDQMDKEAVATETSLQEERNRRVALEKQMERRSGRGRGGGSKEQTDVMPVNDTQDQTQEIRLLQTEIRKLQKEASLVAEIHGRQRSVYECGIRELMRMVQLQGAQEGSSKMMALIDENDRLRVEVQEIRVRHQE